MRELAIDTGLVGFRVILMAEWEGQSLQDTVYYPTDRHTCMQSC